MTTQTVTELVAALESFVGVAARVGYPSLMAYYHDEQQCENPECCAHCCAMKQGREAIAKATA